MPNCVTHFLHAKQVLSKLDDSFKKDLNKNAYFWAAQGPDFFFSHRYFPWMRGKSLKHIGIALHGGDPAEFFETLRSYLAKHDLPLYRSYILGLVNHYTLDSKAHPYVNALVEELIVSRPDQTGGTLHAEIESALDTIMLRRETGRLPTQIHMGKLFPQDAPVQLAIGRLYKYLASSLLDEDIEEAGIVQSTKDVYTIYSALTDRTTMKKKVMDWLEKGKPHDKSSHFLPLTENPEYDYANLSHTPWQDENQVFESDFFEIYDEAIQLSVEIIEQFETCDFEKITQGRTFSGTKCVR